MQKRTVQTSISARAQRVARVEELNASISGRENFQYLVKEKKKTTLPLSRCFTVRQRRKDKPPAEELSPNRLTTHPVTLLSCYLHARTREVPRTQSAYPGVLHGTLPTRTSGTCDSAP